MINIKNEALSPNIIIVNFPEKVEIFDETENMNNKTNKEIINNTEQISPIESKDVLIKGNKSLKYKF